MGRGVECILFTHSLSSLYGVIMTLCPVFGWHFHVGNPAVMFWSRVGTRRWFVWGQFLWWKAKAPQEMLSGTHLCKLIYHWQIWMIFQISNVHAYFSNWCLRHLFWNFPQFRWLSLDLIDKSTLVQVWWQQAITWAGVDLVLCHHMVSLGCNELSNKTRFNSKLVVIW